MPERKLTDKAYSQLLRLYPREFRERFGAEIEQNFADLSREREVRDEFKWLRVAWLFGESILQAVRQNAAEIGGRNVTKILSPTPRTALVVAILFALPMAIIFPVAVLNLEPLNGFFKTQLENENNSQHLIGLFFMLASMLMLPLGGVIGLTPVFRSTRSGAGLLEHRSNLAVGALLTLFGLGLWAMIFIDQVPCMMGVPNCD